MLIPGQNSFCNSGHVGIQNIVKIIPVPVIQAQSKSFQDKLTIEVQLKINDKIYYLFNEPSTAKIKIGNSTEPLSIMKLLKSRQKLATTEGKVTL
jgi:hypothetical protein